MKIFKAKYYFNYNGTKEERIEELTERRLDELKQLIDSKNKYYSDLEILKELGEEDKSLVDTWLKIGRKNYWINEAWDPEFTENSFCECKELSYLAQLFEHGNWCLGQAFYYKNLCFINQVNGGDEYLVIRDDIDFESMSCGLIIKHHGFEYFKALVNDILNATPEELKSLNYTKESQALRV